MKVNTHFANFYWSDLTLLFTYCNWCCCILLGTLQQIWRYDAAIANHTELNCKVNSTLQFKVLQTSSLDKNLQKNPKSALTLSSMVSYKGHPRSHLYILTRFAWYIFFPLLVLCYSPFPAILLLRLGNCLGCCQEGSHGRISALISPFGGNEVIFECVTGSEGNWSDNRNDCLQQ